MSHTPDDGQDTPGREEHRLRLLLDNLQDPASTGARAVTVSLGGTYRQGDLLRLTGPSLATTSTP